MKRLVIGMTAHVDAGKTTLAEALLYNSGTIRKLGRVDHKDTFLDTHSIERKRGITVFSKQALMKDGEDEYYLLDTPGHADLSAETERAMSVLDAAILVISASDGVQSHTLTVWELLGKYRIPVFIFVNKTDICPFDREYVLSGIKKELSDKIVNFSDREELFENAAVCSEELMEEYLDTGRISDASLSEAVMNREIFPCCFGSALKLSGVDELFELLRVYAKEPQRSGQFGARVYKISYDGANRLTHMKITGGELRVRDSIQCGHDGISEKINRIMIFSGEKAVSVNEAGAGTLCAVTGLSGAYAGEGLGCMHDAARPYIEPVLTYRAVFPPELDPHTVLSQLRKLEDEDPRLHIKWDGHSREINVSIMGEMQLEVLGALIKERFGFDMSFDGGSIAYRETIAEKTEGIGHYEPLRHYAEVHLIMEPLPQGSGLVFAAECPEEVLDRSWQRLILTHLAEKQHIGVLTGSPITDMKITVASGRAHLKHTEGGDFRQATYRAVRMGLHCAKSVLLEPWYSFRLTVPEESDGRALTDLQKLGAQFSQPKISDGTAVIEGTAAVAQMRSYHTDVAGYTRGKGKLSCTVNGYFPCKDEQKVIDEIGYNSESDLDNPADSIFCSHGAGFAVKWDEVRKYMHVAGCLTERRTQEPADTAEKPAAHSSSIYDDKELMAIFERTYGKIKRSERQAMQTQKERKDKEYVYIPSKTLDEYLLVDGYNIIYAWDELSQLAKDNLDLARTTLINAMCNYQGFCGVKLILVFDAYRVKGNVRETETVGGISVVYTKEAETADMYIEKVSHELGKKYRVRVATSDRLEQIIIMGSGAYRMSASEFHDEVMSAERSIRKLIEENNDSNLLK